MKSKRSTIVVFTGDPAGVGSEVAIKALLSPEIRALADFIIVSSRACIRAGEQIVGASLGLGEPVAPTRGGGALQFAKWEHVDDDGFDIAKVSGKNGRFMLDGLAYGLKLCVDGVADGMCIAPLNKSALASGGMKHPDEINYFREVLSFKGKTVEFNVNEKLWTSRITSHVPHKDVSGLITEEKIIDGVHLLSQGLKESGVEKPRIAVCGLNPHNGENGNFGMEEIEVIAPAVRKAQEKGYTVEGPIPSDTVFVRALGDKSDLDGVLTMYHDQGQIAMKLVSFGRGVTVHYGLPMPITTPSHGTAYDIYGQGIASPQAMKNALNTVTRMAESKFVVS